MTRLQKRKSVAIKCMLDNYDVLHACERLHMANHDALGEYNMKGNRKFLECVLETWENPNSDYDSAVLTLVQTVVEENKRIFSDLPLDE